MMTFVNAIDCEGVIRDHENTLILESYKPNLKGSAYWLRVGLVQTVKIDFLSVSLMPCT